MSLANAECVSESVREGKAYTPSSNPHPHPHPNPNQVLNFQPLVAAALLDRYGAAWLGLGC